MCERANKARQILGKLISTTKADDPFRAYYTKLARDVQHYYETGNGADSSATSQEPNSVVHSVLKSCSLAKSHSTFHSALDQLFPALHDLPVLDSFMSSNWKIVFDRFLSVAPITMRDHELFSSILDLLNEALLVIQKLFDEKVTDISMSTTPARLVSDRLPHLYVFLDDIGFLFLTSFISFLEVKSVPTDSNSIPYSFQLDLLRLMCSFVHNLMRVLNLFARKVHEPNEVCLFDTIVKRKMNPDQSFEFPYYHSEKADSSCFSENSRLLKSHAFTLLNNLAVAIPSVLCAIVMQSTPARLVSGDADCVHVCVKALSVLQNLLKVDLEVVSMLRNPLRDTYAKIEQRLIQFVTMYASETEKQEQICNQLMESSLYTLMCFAVFDVQDDISISPTRGKPLLLYLLTQRMTTSSVTPKVSSLLFVCRSLTMLCYSQDFQHSFLQPGPNRIISYADLLSLLGQLLTICYSYDDDTKLHPDITTPPESWTIESNCSILSDLAISILQFITTLCSSSDLVNIECANASAGHRLDQLARILLQRFVFVSSQRRYCVAEERRLLAHSSSAVLSLCFNTKHVALSCRFFPWLLDQIDNWADFGSADDKPKASKREDLVLLLVILKGFLYNWTLPSRGRSLDQTHTPLQSDLILTVPLLLLKHWKAFLKVYGALKHLLGVIANFIAGSTEAKTALLASPERGTPSLLNHLMSLVQLPTSHSAVSSSFPIVSQSFCCLQSLVLLPQAAITLNKNGFLARCLAILDSKAKHKYEALILDLFCNISFTKEGQSILFRLLVPDHLDVCTKLFSAKQQHLRTKSCLMIRNLCLLPMAKNTLTSTPGFVDSLCACVGTPCEELASSALGALVYNNQKNKAIIKRRFGGDAFDEWRNTGVLNINKRNNIAV